MTKNALTDPKIKNFVRKLYATKMQSFINIGNKKVFQFCNLIFFPMKVIRGQRSRCQMKARYDFLSKANSNCMPI